MQGIGSFATHHSCCHLWEIKELRRLHTDEELNDYLQQQCGSKVSHRALQGNVWGQISKKRLIAA